MMKNYKIELSAILCMILMVLSSCKRHDTDLKSFVEYLSREMDQKQLNKFKNTELDEAGINLKSIDGVIRHEIGKLETKSALSKHLDSVSSITDVKVQYVSIALYLYCNNKPIVFEEIKKEIRKVSNYEIGKIYMKDMAIKQQIAKKNFNRFRLGDTVSVFFPIDSETGRREISYYAFYVPDSTYFKEEMIQISGIIKDKYFSTYNEKIKDSTDLIFRLKILYVTDPEIWIASEKLKDMKNFDLNVTLYSRFLKRGLGAASKL